MTNFGQYCGIDVSKDLLDYCLNQGLSNPDCHYEQLANQSELIAKQFSAAEFDNTLFILENTGNYSAKVLHELNKLNRPVCVVSPLKSKSFMSALGHTNKNDKQAAFALTIMGQQMSLRLYKAPSEEMQKRQQILGTLQALQKQQRMLENQLHALEQLPILEAQSRQALQAVLDSVQAQIEPLKAALAQKAQDRDFNEKKKYATSVKGIGDKTAEAVLLATNGFDSFDNPDQVSKFLGLTPHTHYSGSSVRKKGHITKFGNNQVRSLLYMCSKTAIQYNQPCKELYERLRKKGKPHKVAAVAVMHKLVKQVFACVTSKTLFDNEFHLNKQNKN